MTITTDQYIALSKLMQWYDKYSHQVIEISGVVGTGVMEVIRQFISNMDFDPREVMYLSFDQKQVLEMAAKRYHAYYINGIIYNYTKITDLDTLPVVNPNSREVEYKWTKKVKKKIDPKYKLIIVFDSVLMSRQMLEDLCSFGLPIILIKDPMAIPSESSYTFFREPNIELHELNPELIKNPLIYFANRALEGKPIPVGNFDNVSIIPKKQLNIYTLKSTEMILTMSSEMSNYFNKMFRERVLRALPGITILNERVVVTDSLYDHKLVNPDEKNIKIYLHQGIVGFVSKINRHAPGTRYVPITFRPDFYHESFEDLYLDRHYLNGVNTPSRQQLPEDILKTQYAYALSPELARLSHWDKAIIITDYSEDDYDLRKRLLYNAITKAKESMTLVI